MNIYMAEAGPVWRWRRLKEPCQVSPFSTSHWYNLLVPSPAVCKEDFRTVSRYHIKFQMWWGAKESLMEERADTGGLCFSIMVAS